MALEWRKKRSWLRKYVEEICKYFGIDPYASISEGTLIIACKENKVDQIIQALSNKDISSSVVGEFTHPEQRIILIEEGKEKELKHPIVDPFWRAFYDALKKYK